MLLLYFTSLVPPFNTKYLYVSLTFLNVMSLILLTYSILSYFPLNRVFFNGKKIVYNRVFSYFFSWIHNYLYLYNVFRGILYHHVIQKESKDRYFFLIDLLLNMCE